MALNEPIRDLCQFHRNWASICRYLLKQDGQPLVWGEFSLDEIRDIAAGPSLKSATKVRTSTPAEQLQLMETTPSDIIIQKLERCGDWYEIYDDPILRDLAVHSYESLKKLYGDLMVLRDMRTTLGERFLSYLDRQGQPAEYEFEELQERYLLLDWLASCLCFHRPIMAKQLFLYGVPKSQRRLLFYLLSPVLRILFTTSSRVEEALSEGNPHFDLCVLEEYPDQSLIVFEGSPPIFHKKGNLPIVVLATSLEASADGINPNPFRSRFIRLRFSSQIPDLDEGRLIATLWGCVRRRVSYSPYAFFSTTPNDLCLDYRDSKGYFIPDDLNPEKRSFHKMRMDRYMGFSRSWP
ncbi:hypothetical protein OROMI_034518 [Orobanche minor]